ncbi:MAG: phosphoribosylformylglycinamidine cyclo-ligase [Nanoarchaeota archaeon]
MTTYKDAGVDIDAQDKAIGKIKSYVKNTRTKASISDVGNFGGLFDIGIALKEMNINNPVLVSSSDGVGTKVKLASLTKKFHTVGQDLVNHCVNDILVQGAFPLYFNDYIASSKLDPDETSEVIRGLTIACKENNMALLGGEMAEMPGVYHKGHFDLAGFIVGVVDKSRIIDGSKITNGDVIMGLPSNGLMTNGYSLAIKVFDEAGILNQKAEELMNIHPSFLNLIKPVLINQPEIIKGMAHITGGGLVDNIPRILPENVDAKITKSSWEVPKLFLDIKKQGNVPEDDMYRTFNMGIGFIVITKKEDSNEILNLEGSKVIGEIVSGNKKVILE